MNLIEIRNGFEFLNEDLVKSMLGHTDDVVDYIEAINDADEFEAYKNISKEELKADFKQYSELK